MARVFAVNDEFVWTLNDFIVTVARHIPHGELVSFFDDFAANLHILKRGPPHVGQGGLVANDFRNHIGH